MALEDESSVDVFVMRSEDCEGTIVLFFRSLGVINLDSVVENICLILAGGFCW